MSLQLCVLGSGSSGNCTVLRTPRGVVLIDAGLGPRTTAARMKGTGVGVGDVGAVVLTHLDRDHFNLNWVKPLVRRSVSVFCHAACAAELRRLVGDPCFDALLRTFDDQPFEPLTGLTFGAVPLAHDAEGSHGFLIEGHGCRAGYATDLGHVPALLIERFTDVDMLAMESNYDPQMQQSSSRPLFLKQRIMGGRGHLSNKQAFDAVRAILDACERRGNRLPGHIVLLHRSLECNCPQVIRRLFERDARIAPRLTLTEQHRRTPWLGAVPAAIGKQLLLAWS